MIKFFLNKVWPNSKPLIETNEKNEILLFNKEIEKTIQRIEDLNLEELSIEEIKEVINPLFIGYSITTPILPIGLNLFRGISYDSKPDNISSLSYPPKEFANRGRVSEKSNPYFYSSTCREIPFFELPLKRGDKVALSRWTSKKEIFVNNIGFTDSNFRYLNSNRECPRWKDYIKTNNLDTVINQRIQNFLAKKFCQAILDNELEKYKLTIAIAEKHFSEDENSQVNFDGILYPTIQMKANADNLALRKSFIDDGNLEFKEVEWIEILNVNDFNYDINILDWANSLNELGEIEWKGRLPLWDILEDEGFYFIKEFGRKVGKNIYGETIEPY